MVEKEKKLLLHACCAPCLSHVYETLKDSFDIHVFFYNPNIAPRDEYQRRLDELSRFSAERNFTLSEGDYDLKIWTAAVRPYRYYGERSERCWNCYRVRLEASFIAARRLGMDMVGTVLSISPHKDAEKINEIGSALATEYSIPFLEANFKKNDGFKKSLELSKKYDFYRQEYCGCIYSKLERERDPRWIEKITSFQEKLEKNKS